MHVLRVQRTLSTERARIVAVAYPLGLVQVIETRLIVDDMHRVSGMRLAG
jgi:hypothetical protein